LDATQEFVWAGLISPAEDVSRIAAPLEVQQNGSQPGVKGNQARLLVLEFPVLLGSDTDLIAFKVDVFPLQMKQFTRADPRGQERQ